MLFGLRVSANLACILAPSAMTSEQAVELCPARVAAACAKACEPCEQIVDVRLARTEECAKTRRVWFNLAATIVVEYVPWPSVIEREPEPMASKVSQLSRSSAKPTHERDLEQVASKVAELLRSSAKPAHVTNKKPAASLFAVLSHRASVSRARAGHRR